MYEVKVEAQFNAAHRLRNYRGKCEKLHGHNWKVEVSVCSRTLNKSGIVVDFKELRAALEKSIKMLDHSYLNELRFFKKTNPTSENIAKFIYDTLKRKGFAPSKVSVWESDKSRASYSE